MKLHTKLTKASKFVRKYIFKHSGKSWKSHQRPRYPWYEMYWHDSVLKITMWRRFGGNTIELKPFELERFIEMLQAAKESLNEHQ